MGTICPLQEVKYSDSVVEFRVEYVKSLVIYKLYTGFVALELVVTWLSSMSFGYVGYAAGAKFWCLQALLLVTLILIWALHFLSIKEGMHITVLMLSLLLNFVGVRIVASGERLWNSVEQEIFHRSGNEKGTPPHAYCRIVYEIVLLSQFLDREKISRVFVHEYIERSSIRYCLAFLIQGDTSLELCYRYVYPGLPSLQRIFSLCSDEVWKESKNQQRSVFK
jgi:hypothetical protein